MRKYLEKVNTALELKLDPSLNDREYFVAVSNKVDWDYICHKQRMSQNFEDVSDRSELDWLEAEEKAIESQLNDWEWISKHHKLSERFIRKFANKVHWVNIFKYQNLSEEFKKEFAVKV